MIISNNSPNTMNLFDYLVYGVGSGNYWF